MPVVRQPLRKRCNVQLSVVTCLSCHDISNDDNPTRGRSRTRHRKISAKRKKFKSPRSSYVKGEAVVPMLPRSKGNHHLQSYCELIPFLSIALSDGSFDPSSLQLPASSASLIPFTHFIRIQYPTPLLGFNPGHAWSEYHLKTGISVLNLIIPKPQQRQSQEQTLLTEHQLLLSRDFLSLALPYYCRSEPPKWANELSSADMVHVLITAPAGQATGSSGVVDVMSIVVCYLTFAGGQESTTVVDCVDGEVDDFGLGVADVWRGRVKGDGVEVIQRVAIAP